MGKITIWVNRASAQEFSSAQVNNFVWDAAASDDNGLCTPRARTIGRLLVVIDLALSDTLARSLLDSQ